MGFLSSLTGNLTRSKNRSGAGPKSASPEDHLGNSLGSASSIHKDTGAAAKKAKAPTPEKKKDVLPKGGNIFEKVFNRNGYDDKQLARARAALESMSLDDALGKFLPEFTAFCEREFSPENLDCYQAVAGGASKRGVYNTWIKGKVPEVNIPNSVKADPGSEGGQGRLRRDGLLRAEERPDRQPGRHHVPLPLRREHRSEAHRSGLIGGGAAPRQGPVGAELG